MASAARSPRRRRSVSQDIAQSSARAEVCKASSPPPALHEERSTEVSFAPRGGRARAMASATAASRRRTPAGRRDSRRQVARSASGPRDYSRSGSWVLAITLGQDGRAPITLGQGGRARLLSVGTGGPRGDLRGGERAEYRPAEPCRRPPSSS